MIADRVRPDGDLLAEVRARLDADRPDGSASQYELSVAGGRAMLVGHVRSRAVALALVATAGEVRGVSRVDERLVADDELELRVAAAIAAASARASRLAVRADLGHVRVGGLYWSPQVRSDALRAAALVPGVLAARPVPASEIADRSVRVETIWS
jgi:osmotically-inducible protein OsmY